MKRPPSRGSNSGPRLTRCFDAIVLIVALTRCFERARLPAAPSHPSNQDVHFLNVIPNRAPSPVRNLLFCRGWAINIVLHRIGLRSSHNRDGTSSREAFTPESLPLHSAAQSAQCVPSLSCCAPTFSNRKSPASASKHPERRQIAAQLSSTLRPREVCVPTKFHATSGATLPKPWRRQLQTGPPTEEYLLE